MYAGAPWQLNDYPLLHNPQILSTTPEPAAVNTPADNTPAENMNMRPSDVDIAKTSPLSPPNGYILYIMAAASNAYQTAAAGLDKNANGLVQAFAAAFQHPAPCAFEGGVQGGVRGSEMSRGGRQGGGGVEPLIPTNYTGHICDLGAELAPYNIASDPMPVSYAATVVPNHMMPTVRHR